MRIIKFGAMWCPSCLIMRPRWEKIEKTYNLNSEFFDYDMNEEEVKKYGIGKILPVVIIMNNDEEIVRIIGEKSEKEIIEILKEKGVI